LVHESLIGFADAGTVWLKAQSLFHLHDSSLEVTVLGFLLSLFLVSGDELLDPSFLYNRLQALPDLLIAG